MITKAQEAKIRAYGKTPKEHQSVLQVREITKTGLYWLLPLIGWVEPLDPHASITILGTLLKVSDQSYAGSGVWIIPASDKNREDALRVLAALGWNGKLWPQDEEWPTGAVEEEGLRHLLERVHITNTFSFSPDPKKGNRVMKVIVSKTVGSMPLPLEVAPEDTVTVTATMRQRMDEYLADPTLFVPVRGKKRRFLDLNLNPSDASSR